MATDTPRYMAGLYKKISRKRFLSLAASGAALLGLEQPLLRFARAVTTVEPSSGRAKRSRVSPYDLIEVKNEDAYQATVKAVSALGGMEQFVAKDNVVLIKPNIGWDRSPEQAANTNPQVVAALVDLSFKAGAKRVNVFDRTCNEARRCYAHSGIQDAAKARGAQVFHPSEWNVVAMRRAYQSPLQDWPIFREAVECDVFINVPVLKHHGYTELTLSMKNLMGVCAGNRGIIHQDIGRKLVDLTDFIAPDLTIIDAMRYLTQHGPQGGDLEDVVALNTVIAGIDPVLCDTYAAAMVGKDPLSLPYIAAASARGFGRTDIEHAAVLKIA